MPFFARKVNNILIKYPLSERWNSRMMARASSKRDYAYKPRLLSLYRVTLLDTLFYAFTDRRICLFSFAVVDYPLLGLLRRYLYHTYCIYTRNWNRTIFVFFIAVMNTINRTHIRKRVNRCLSWKLSTATWKSPHDHGVKIMVRYL